MKRCSAFTAGPEGLSRAMLSICVMLADLVASLQIFDVMEMWYPFELAKKLCLAVATIKHKQRSSSVAFFQTNILLNVMEYKYERTISLCIFFKGHEWFCSNVNSEKL